MGTRFPRSDETLLRLDSVQRNRQGYIEESLCWELQTTFLRVGTLFKGISIMSKTWWKQTGNFAACRLVWNENRSLGGKGTALRGNRWNGDWVSRIKWDSVEWRLLKTDKVSWSENSGEKQTFYKIGTPFQGVLGTVLRARKDPLICGC